MGTPGYFDGYDDGARANVPPDAVQKESFGPRFPMPSALSIRPDIDPSTGSPSDEERNDESGSCTTVKEEDVNMEWDAHFEGLKRMYESAPCNVPLGVELTVREAEAEVRMPVTEQLFHAAGAVYGSYYFKVLDDACYFASNSLVPDVFVLTVSFHLQLLRPLSSGALRSVGRVVRSGKTLLFAEAIAYGDDDLEVARGNGVFSRGPLRLVDVPGYTS